MCAQHLSSQSTWIKRKFHAVCCPLLLLCCILILFFVICCSFFRSNDEEMECLYRKFKRCAFVMNIVWNFIWKQIICYNKRKTNEDFRISVHVFVRGSACSFFTHFIWLEKRTCVFTFRKEKNTNTEQLNINESNRRRKKKRSDHLLNQWHWRRLCSYKDWCHKRCCMRRLSQFLLIIHGWFKRKKCAV